MKIAIATGGRFHVLDLARELSHLGHEVDFTLMFLDVEQFDSVYPVPVTAESYRWLLHWSRGSDWLLD